LPLRLPACWDSAWGSRWRIGQDRPVSVNGAHRLNADLGADVTLETNQGSALALSPDGTLLAFIAENGANGCSQLYL
jgi:hypothetical protein